MSGIRWSQKETEMLFDLWGHYKATTVVERINRACGKNRTVHATRRKAYELGLDSREAQGYLTLSEAARQMGIAMKTLHEHIKRKGIRPIPGRLYAFLRHEDFEKLKAYYAKPAEPCVSLTEAAKRLGHQRPVVEGWVRRGRLRSVRMGGRIKIPLAAIEQFRWDQARARRKGA